jgi:hypothetical protein
MGVEFRTLLIPRDNTFRPDVAGARLLIAAWRQAGFLPSADAVLRFPGRETRFDEHSDLSAPEFMLQWSIDDRRLTNVRHPLTDIVEDPEQGAYYDIRLHFSDDFIEVASELINPPLTECTCGEDLAYEPEADIFYAARIRRVCAVCGEAYRPQDHIGSYRDGITGAERELIGGANHRFAIVIDCGKHWRTRSERPPVVSGEFAEASTSALGVLLYEVGDFY